MINTIEETPEQRVVDTLMEFINLNRNPEFNVDRACELIILEQKENWMRFAWNFLEAAKEFIKAE